MLEELMEDETNSKLGLSANSPLKGNRQLDSGERTKASLAQIIGDDDVDGGLNFLMGGPAPFARM